MKVYYDWAFTLSLVLKSGKKRHAHTVITLGQCYSDAYRDMIYELKKRKTVLVSVVKVKVISVAFALDGNGNFVNRSLVDGMPEIPDNLNL